MYKKTACYRTILTTLLLLVLAMTACSQESVDEEVSPPPQGSIAPTDTESVPIENPAPEPEQEELQTIPGGPYAGGFALSNESGTKLMIFATLSEISPDEFSIGENPELLDVAIGPDNKLVQVCYSGYQDTGVNFWPSVQNFDTVSGHIYELIGDNAKPGDTYFVTSSDSFAQSLVPISTTRKLGVFNETPIPAARDSAVAKKETEKGLDVIFSETLATVGTDGFIELFQYERVGDDMLFEIVYDNGNREINVEFPTNRGGWRVDAGDTPGVWFPLFFCDINGIPIMATLWGAPEAGNFEIWFERDGKWIEDDYMHTYWYWATY